MKDLLAKGKEVPRGQGTGEREQRMDEAKEGKLSLSLGSDNRMEGNVRSYRNAGRRNLASHRRAGRVNGLLSIVRGEFEGNLSRNAVGGESVLLRSEERCQGVF